MSGVCCYALDFDVQCGDRMLEKMCSDAREPVGLFGGKAGACAAHGEKSAQVVMAREVVAQTICHDIALTDDTDIASREVLLYLGQE